MIGLGALKCSIEKRIGKDNILFMTKVCSKCKVEKSLTGFYKDKRHQDGLTSGCKLCQIQSAVKHKEEKRQYDKQYRTCNKEKLRQQKKKYCVDHKKEKAQYDKQHFLDNKEEIKQKHKEYYFSNKKEIRQKQKQYYVSHKQEIRQHNNQYQYNRSKIDIQYKLRKSVRHRLYLARKNNQKAGSAVRDLGCTILELKIYIESKFQPGMSWDNWCNNGWHIDHIIPLDSLDLTDREQLLKACHYTNLQPLWAKDNISKGGRKLD